MYNQNTQKQEQTVTNRQTSAQSGLLCKEERFHWILERLARDGRVVATDLTTELGVSEDTVRRDLRELASLRQIRRVHGGALPPSPVALSYAARERQSVPQKRSIALAASALIEDDQLVFLDGGTTNVLVAESLRPNLRATIVTNSVPVAQILCEHSGVELILIGGKLLKGSRVATGAGAVESIAGFRADLLLLGTCSVDIDAGITVPHFDEAPVKRAMIGASSRVIGLATAEKLGTAMACVVGPISELDAIVTEAGAPAHLTEPYRASGVEIIQGERVE